MIRDTETLLDAVRQMHRDVRSAVIHASETTDQETLGAVVREQADDVIFRIDQAAEETLRTHIHRVAERWPCVFIAEGIPGDGPICLPPGTARADAEIRIIIDPIDGTRGLIYGKRSAWILTGIAPNRGPETSLADIELAVQTEIPFPKQHLCDTLWAQAGSGAHARRWNRITDEESPLELAPSESQTIAHAYGCVSRFFPGGRDILAAIDDEIVRRVLGPLRPGSAPAFEDQYASTGGQLHELTVGHDRWIADLRPLLASALSARGEALGHCCHPYDLCTELIAREAGVIVTDEHGRRLAAPLDCTSDVAWIGYANSVIQATVEPALRGALLRRGLLDSGRPGDAGS